MASALKDNSNAVQAVAESLLAFQSHVEASVSAEISSLIAELYSTGSALLEFRAALIEPRYAQRRGLVEEDKYVVLKSLEFTLRDVKKLLGDLNDSTTTAASLGIRVSRRETYRTVWAQIEKFFKNESNNTLRTRFLYYRKFLTNCTNVVKG